MQELRPVRVFLISCPKDKDKKVELSTRNWWEEQDGANHIIHYHDFCQCCGGEVFGGGHSS